MSLLELLSGGSRICYAPEGDDGAGGGGDAGAGDNGDGGDNGAGGEGDKGDAGGQGDAGTGGDDNGGAGGDNPSLLNDIPSDDLIELSLDMTEKPEGLDDSYWDEENGRLDVQKLFEDKQMGDKRIKDLRDKVAKGAPQALENVEDYKFELSETAKAAEVFDGDDDPLVAASQKLAHELGMPGDMYGEFMTKMTDQLVEIAGEMAANPPELTDDQKAEIRQAEYDKIGANAPAVIRAVETWAKELQSKGIFSEQDLEAYKSMAVTGEQVRALNKLRAAMGGSDIPMDLTTDGLPSDEEIYGLMEKANEANDPKLQAQVDELLNKRRAAGRPETLQLNM